MTARPSSLSATEFAETFYKVPAFVQHGIRCGNANCRCATTAYRHGPYAYLFWRDAGRLRRRYVPMAEVDEVRAIIEARQAIARERRADHRNAVAYLRDLRRRMRELERAGGEAGLW